MLDIRTMFITFLIVFGAAAGIILATACILSALIEREEKNDDD